MTSMWWRLIVTNPVSFLSLIAFLTYFWKLDEHFNFKFPLKRLYDVISTDPTFVKVRVGFTTVSFKLFIDQGLQLRTEVEKKYSHLNFRKNYIRLKIFRIFEKYICSNAALSLHCTLEYTPVPLQFEHLFRDKLTEFSSLDKQSKV